MYRLVYLFQLRTVHLLALFAHPLLGGVVLDGSFGTRGSLPGPNFMITAPMGKQVGGNLFQSFSQFNLNSSQSATFTGPPNVHNILARVTGGSPSSIDGTIRSDIQGANLFFMNPSGVLFGQHAQLDVSGSFAVTTANYLNLVGGGRFNANLGGDDVLTSAPVSAFGFLTSGPERVSFIGTNTIDRFTGTITPGPGLNIAPQKSFSVIAGDITMHASAISGPGSRVNLVSVKSPGEATLEAASRSSAIDVTQFNALGTIRLTNLALIDTSAQVGGPVAVRGGTLHLDNSRIISESRIIDDFGDPIPTSIRGGDIDIDVAGSLGFTNGGSILAANGGDIKITADAVLIRGSGNFPSGILSGESADSNFAGLHGNIELQTRSLMINGFSAEVSVDRGQVPFGTRTEEHGNINLMLDSLKIADGGMISCDASWKWSNDGNITITANSVVLDHGTIDAGGGVGPQEGNITITANSIVLDHGTIRATAALGLREGNITIRAHDVRLVNSGQIDADQVFSDVSAPQFDPTSSNITLTADSLLIDGTKRGNSGDVVAGIFDVPNIDSIQTYRVRKGSITVEVQSLMLVGGSKIASNGSSSNDGGNISVSASSVLITGEGSAIQAEAQPWLEEGFEWENSIANAGSVTVRANDLTLLNGGQISSSSISLGNGGSVTVTSDSLSINGAGSGIFANTKSGVFVDPLGGEKHVFTGSGNAGNVLVQSKSLTIGGDGEISSSTVGLGRGGSVSVTANSLVIHGIDSGIFSAAESGSSGNAGNIAVKATDLTLTSGGKISSATFSAGTGGSVNVTADSILINGGDSGIFASAQEHSSGNAGSVAVYAGNLAITDGGEVSSGTGGTGNGGDVDVTTDSLLIDGAGDSSFGTGIFADTGNRGDAGSVSVQARSVTLIGGGEISSGTFSTGNGGSVTVASDSVLINGAGTSPFVTGIFASAEEDSSGNAGRVTVNARNLVIIDNGEISSGTGGTGNGGDVNVTTESLLIDGAGHSGFGTGIFADTGNRGDAGIVSVQARSVTLTGGGQISSETFGAGRGGSVTVATDSLLINGAGAPRNVGTGVFATAEDGSSGDAGSLSVQARSLTLTDRGEISSTSFTSATAGSVQLNTAGPVKLKHGASISTSSESGDAGSIKITSGGEIKLKDQSSITVSGGRNGGEIRINAPDLVYLLDSSITATAGGVGGSGTGGNITIDPQFIVLQNSFISANAAIGQGGNIKLVSDFLFNSDLSNNNITATGTTNGTVNITAPQLDLGSELITLPTSLLSAESQLQERCTALLRGDFSSFISIGRGGTEPAPEELQSTF